MRQWHTYDKVGVDFGTVVWNWIYVDLAEFARKLYFVYIQIMQIYLYIMSGTFHER